MGAAYSAIENATAMLVVSFFFDEKALEVLDAFISSE
jgi:hypothetical protein